MGAKRWTIKLKCGHWSVRLKPWERDVVLAKGAAQCETCGAVAALTDTERLGGLTITQTEEVKAKRANGGGFVPRPVKSLPGGLLVREISDARCQWWCRWCFGKKPGKQWVSHCDLDDLTAEWVAHTDTLRHRNERSTRDRVSNIVSNL